MFRSTQALPTVKPHRCPGPIVALQNSTGTQRGHFTPQGRPKRKSERAHCCDISGDLFEWKRSRQPCNKLASTRYFHPKNGQSY